MSDPRPEAEMLASLSAYGADLSRWPAEAVAGAREALLSQPAFRHAWEGERALDRELEAVRGGLDDEVRQSGATERVRRKVMARLPSATFAGLRWQRIAAAVVMAGMLGGAMDVVMAEDATDTPDLVLLDPLYALDETAVE